MLHGIGLALAGCKMSLDSFTPDPDAPAPDANEPPVPCEPGKVCVDITRPSAADLATVGGALRVPIANDTLIVVRTGDTTFEVTSAICTHKRCLVNWNGTVLRCPCHLSQFSLDGAVLNGPASTPLKAYVATFDPATSIVTITV